jgi:exopolyphosphatase/guanosine-5'-triphosphate,3'-diphosphate pyrophosphatase
MRLRVAAIDIGTNTTRLLVAETGAGSMRDLDRRMEFTRLGASVDSTGSFQEAAIARTLVAVGEFCAVAGEFSVERLRVAGTSAMRDSVGSAKLVEALEQVSGNPVEILTGEQEGFLSFLGGTKDLSAALCLVCDIGGGSTELAIGASGSPPEGVVSLDIGSVRLTERILKSDPPAIEEMLLLEHEIDEMLHEVPQIFALAEEARLVGVAGTVTTLAALSLGLEAHDPSRTHGFELDVGSVRRLYRRLASMTTKERLQLRGMPQGRADVIVAGASILSRVIARWSFESLIVSETDILDGLVLDMLATGDIDG